jgi:hypothetical protein
MFLGRKLTQLPGDELPRVGSRVVGQITIATVLPSNF